MQLVVGSSGVGAWLIEVVRYLQILGLYDGVFWWCLRINGVLWWCCFLWLKNRYMDLCFYV